MGDSTRSDVWLRILGSLLRGTDIALLKDSEELAKITDQLERLHYERFGERVGRGSTISHNARASAIVAKWRGSTAASPMILCIKELRTEFNWSLREARAYVDSQWW